MEFLRILIWMVLGGVVVVIGLGFYALYRGGDFGRNWSNKLMRLRIVFQAVAVLLVVLWAFLQVRHR
jgi:type II secretory pathway component PulF